MSRVVKAEILWFNAAKGYGLARPDDFNIEDIRFQTSSVVNQGVIQADMRGVRAEITFKEDLIGPVAEKVTILDLAADREKLLQLAQRMPKVDLLVHLEGAISPSTLFVIIQRNNYPLPVKNEEELVKLFRFRNFAHFIRMYARCSNALHTADDYAQITYEYLRTASEQNIKYVEAYFSPYDHIQQGLNFADIVDGISRGKVQALTEFGIQAGFVVNVGRHLLWTENMDSVHAQRECLRMAELSARFKDQGVIGFSIGGEEIGYPVYPFVDAFECARHHGLHTKAYSGEEAYNSADIKEVIDLLQVERIGNPVCAWEDKTLVERIVQNQIPFEMCITGNVLTGATTSESTHPFPYYRQQGIPVTLGSGNPSLFNTTLTREYQLTVEHFNFSADDLQKLALDSIDISWLPDEEKNKLRTLFIAEIAKLREELGI